MKEKIGVFGSAVEGNSALHDKLKKLAEVLAEKQVIILTGAGPGLPYLIAKTAFDLSKTEIWGFSVGRNLEEQTSSDLTADNSIYSQLLYVPVDFPFADDLDVTRKYRNVLSTATCDGAIIVAGRIGTLNEYTNLFDMGKVIGVLTGTGGVADMIEDLNSQISKKSKAKVIFHDDPQTLVESVLAEIQGRKTS